MQFKTYYIQTFGCAMNEYDSERIAAALERAGLMPVSSNEEADVIIVNTCSVREKPQIKISSYLGRIRMRKDAGQHILIGITGCVAQQEGKLLLKQFKAVDFVIGTNALGKIDEIVQRALNGERFAETDLEDNKDAQFSISNFKRKEAITAFVTVMKGCENFCSYCIVPYVRGKEASRSSREIVDEVKRLVDDGVREVCLLGQNVNSYGTNLADNIDFSDLLKLVNKVDGLNRIRFLTSHPKDYSEKMIHTIAECEKIWNFIHLPLQAGSDKILKLMNRVYTFKEYAEKIELTRKIIPNASFSSDFIVGFPGETEEDFEQTLNAIKIVGYDQVFAFNYSPRPKTAAFELSDDLEQSVKAERLARLFDLQNAIYEERLKTISGSVIDIFVKGKSKSRDGFLYGANLWNKVVNFKTSREIEFGSMVKVLVEKTDANSLIGQEV